MFVYKSTFSSTLKISKETTSSLPAPAAAAPNVGEWGECEVDSPALMPLLLEYYKNI